MYLREIVIHNSGPIASFQLNPEFYDDERPKPIVLVGSNGGGKTNILSIIADSIVEIAASHFNDVAIQRGGGHEYFRIIGGTTIKSGASYEITLTCFSDQYGDRRVVGRAGSVPQEVLTQFGATYPDLNNIPAGTAGKYTSPGSRVEEIFRKGAYAFFQGGRAETPHWAKHSEDDKPGNFDVSITDSLRKPIIITKTIDHLKPWLIDLILDSSIDVVRILQLALDRDKFLSEINVSYGNITSLKNINYIIQSILNNPTAHFARSGRLSGHRKIMIANNGIPIIPSLEALSAGQANLLGMFGTLLRYGDAGRQSQASSDIEGIACIDEIDAQLHPTLQFEALPKLIALFPRVQFIVSSHSPLFALGMKNEFGEDGFSLLEMPEGNHIPSERYKDFLFAFEAFKTTKKFESEIEKISMSSSRPLIICEGETDPKYLLVASEILGFSRIANDCDLDWVGQNVSGIAQGSGKNNLNDAWKFLTNNPTFATREIVLLYDNDTNKPDSDANNIHIRSMAGNPSNNMANGGVESLLPKEAFEEKYYTIQEKIQGTTIINSRILNKTIFCEALCKERDPAKFEGFRSTLEMLDLLIFGPSSITPCQADAK